MASVPPVGRDELTHHLAVPKLYIQKGGIHELPDVTPSYYPQLLDLIYCIPLIFNNDIVPKYIHFSFALFTSLLIFIFLKEKINPFYGLLGAIFFLSLPVIVKLSVNAYVDLGLIFFSTASLLCLLKWQEKQFNFKWLFYSAISCGFALSTKYNGLITCFLLTAFIPIIYLKKVGHNQIKSISHGICFFLIATAIFSPWMIKNYIWTQNPLYPLYDHYFNPETNNSIDGESSEPIMNHFLIRKLIYKEPLIETITIPIRIFFQGEDDNPKLFDGKLNPLLFFLPIFSVISLKKSLVEKKDNYKKILFIFSILYILIVFVQQDMRIRWIGPAIPPLVILSIFGLNNFFQYIIPSIIIALGSVLKPFVKTFSLAFIILIAGLNAVYILQLFRIIEPIPYLTGQITRSEYIEKFRPEYGVIDFANKNLSGEVKIFAFFLGNRRYYSNHEISFNYSQLKHLVQNSKTAAEIFQGLKKLQYSNLIINDRQFYAWLNIEFNKEEKRRVNEFLYQYTKLLFSKNEHGLYELSLSAKEPLSNR